MMRKYLLRSLIQKAQGNKMLERNFPSKMECKWEGNSYKTNDGRHQAVKTFLIVLTVKFFTLFLPCMATSRVGTAKWPQDNLGKFRSKLHGDDPPRIRGQQVMMDPLDPEDGIREAGNGCWDKSWT